MTLERCWTILARQWKIIVLCILIGAIGAYIGSKLTTRLYQSAASIEVHSGGNDYTSTLGNIQLAQTEATLAISSPVLQEVASHYPGLTVDQLAREVTARPQLNTSLFTINVLDASPTRASALANDIATTLIQQQTEQAKQDNAQSQQQLQQDLQQAQQQIRDITNQIAALQAAGGRQADASALTAQLIIAQGHISQVQLTLVQLKAQNFDFLRLAQPAQPSARPAQPNVPLNIAAGLLIGLLLGLLLALLLELLGTRVRTPQALAQLLGWPILATICSADSKKDGVVDLAEQGADAEAYCTLRTNIDFSVIDKPLHSLVVTNAVSGKSSIAANLAISMAKAGKKTILIDADLRHPALHEKFHLPADAKGLSNAILAFSQLGTAGSSQEAGTSLSSDLSLDPYLHTVYTPNLHIMPSGPLPPNPPEMLNSKAMERLLFAATVDYGAEMVILDAPPLLGLSDAGILAPKTDGTIVVIDIAYANEKKLEQVKALLTERGAHVLGCVVSKQGHSRKISAYSSPYTETTHPAIENEAVTSGNDSIPLSGSTETTMRRKQ